MKIVAVRIGDKYGPEYEKYLESKLPEHEFIWVREPINDKIQLQWNKMYGMNLDIDEPIVVMDIIIIFSWFLAIAMSGVLTMFLGMHCWLIYNAYTTIKFCEKYRAKDAKQFSDSLYCSLRAS